MQRNRHERRIWRAVLGVFLLYALVLQGVLGGALARGIDPRAPGVICAAHTSEPGEERDGAAHDASCCTTACQHAPSGPLAPAVSIPTPAGPIGARERRWRALTVNGPPARPPTAANPRAPPALA